MRQKTKQKQQQQKKTTHKKKNKQWKSLFVISLTDKSKATSGDKNPDSNNAFLEGN